ncbi:MAG: hypothetical protein AABY32_03660 [Nanoarchaeota archaeon]
MKIKIPVQEIQKEDICSKVENKLKSDKGNAYTISGLMIELFKVKKEDINNKPFSNWKKGLPTMYSRISRCLRRLEGLGKINSRKHEKAFVYWWVKD